MTYDPNYQPPQAPQYSPPPPPSANYSPPPVAPNDGEHLKILSICWYIASALAALFGFFPLIYVGLGIALASGMIGNRHNDRIPGIIIAIIGTIGLTIIWTEAVLGFMTARSLTTRRRRVLCLVAAGIACLQIPFGVVLGVFTFIVLCRPSVKESFH